MLLKTPEQIALIASSGQVTAAALKAVRQAAKPGVSCAELDSRARESIVAAGGAPNFAAVPGYRWATCISVNDAVVHGIPGDYRLRPGDLVSVDCGTELDGWHSDCALTLLLPVPEGQEEKRFLQRQELSQATHDALWDGIAALRSGQLLEEVGAAIEASLLRSGREQGRSYGILREFAGHGIGRSLHEPPEILNYALLREQSPGAARTRLRGFRVEPGLVVAIEPMVTAGGEDTKVDADNWTVRSADGSDGAHWEHTVAVLEEGLWVCTAADGGAEELGRRGVAVQAPPTA